MRTLISSTAVYNRIGTKGNRALVRKIDQERKQDIAFWCLVAIETRIHVPVFRMFLSASICLLIVVWLGLLVCQRVMADGADGG
jgi:hypothetical protein